MNTFKQIDCFNVHIKFWTITGIWPGDYNPRYYNYYSKTVITIFIIIYNVLFSVNFYFVEKKVESVIQEMIFYFTDVACVSKVFTYLLLYDDIVRLLSILESETFQPVTNNGHKFIENGKKCNVRYWMCYAGFSITCHIAHVFLPVIFHVIFSAPLELPVCSYSFLSDEVKQKFIYPLYFFQSAGIHMTMWYNINIDTFILGVMILTIAQLDILDEKLRNITVEDEIAIDATERDLNEDRERKFIVKFNDCIVHYDKVSKFCALFEQIFSVMLFVQFSMAAYIICVCLFRFTLPSEWQYYIFLAAYMMCMILQVMVPCWFGTKIIGKSTSLSEAIYDCEWISRSRQFKSNMRFFTMYTNRPLSITGWKMFPLSLKTFTAIINSAYSAFALLRHMQTK